MLKYSNQNGKLPYRMCSDKEDVILMRFVKIASYIFCFILFFVSTSIAETAVPDFKFTVDFTRKYELKKADLRSYIQSDLSKFLTDNYARQYCDTAFDEMTAKYSDPIILETKFRGKSSTGKELVNLFSQQLEREMKDSGSRILIKPSKWNFGFQNDLEYRSTVKEFNETSGILLISPS